ncbi:hypothetical protein [Mesorhizobium amorphae]
MKRIDDNPVWAEKPLAFAKPKTRAQFGSRLLLRMRTFLQRGSSMQKTA